MSDGPIQRDDAATNQVNRVWIGNVPRRRASPVSYLGPEEAYVIERRTDTRYVRVDI